MIQYNKVQIDGDYLYVNFEIEDRPYYNEVVLVGYRIDTISTWGKYEPYLDRKLENTTSCNQAVFVPNAKRELLIITPIVANDDKIPADSPCGAGDVNTTAVYNQSVVLSKGMSYLKELGDTCNIPRGLIDFILRHKALDLAISNCDYNTAIKYWNMFTMNSKVTNSGCGCYGK